jgi:hypothetical protein
MKRTQALHEAGQSLWLDNITRALLDAGADLVVRTLDEVSRPALAQGGLARKTEG